MEPSKQGTVGLDMDDKHIKSGSNRQKIYPVAKRTVPMEIGGTPDCKRYLVRQTMAAVDLLCQDPHVPPTRKN